ncbi:MAG: CBS domain-containing protein [Haloarculaceae archaeon]
MTADRREEVIAALEVDAVETRDVMVDAESVVALSVTEPLAANLQRMRENPHSRFPLVDDALADYRGVVYAPAAIRDQSALEAGGATLADVAVEPMRVDATLTVSELIDRFQAEGQELALVFEGEAVVGPVTVTDAVEAITGEVTDPLDAETAG